MVLTYEQAGKTQRTKKYPFIKIVCGAIKIKGYRFPLHQDYYWGNQDKGI